MIDHFGELGLIEKREAEAGPHFPSVMYVETLPPSRGPQLVAAEAMVEAEPQIEGSGVDLEFAQARFGGLRRLR